MAKHGSMITYAPGSGLHGWEKEYVINNEDYRLKVTKTWVPSVDVYHIRFHSQSVYDYQFEVFLQPEELDALINVLNASK
jgi:hypothetical protein